MEENNEFLLIQSKRRFNISRIIIFTSLILLTGISIVAIFTNVSPETVFTALVALVGTWIGTILAFYFSKDNFESASKATQDLVKQITGEQKLKSLPVTDTMIKLEKVNYFMLTEKEESISLEELLAEFKTFNRLPVLNKDQHPLYIIHRSVITQFISDVALGKLPLFKKENLSKLTLMDFNSISENLKLVQNSFVTVKREGNLSNAKKEMESVHDVLCSDVFVTEDGSRKSKVLGWITNQIISEKAQA